MPNPAVDYTIAWALRSQAEFIVGTVDANARMPLDAFPIAKTSLVDAVASVTSFPDAAWGAQPSPDDRSRQHAWRASVEKVCQEWAINTIIPTTDRDQYFLTLMSDAFEDFGVRVLGASHAAVRLLNDKLSFATMCGEAGIQVPETYALDDARAIELVSRVGKVVVKRRFSQGSTRISFVNSQAEFESVLRDVATRDEPKNWVVQQYVRGDLEPSMSVWRTSNGRFPVMVPHVKHRFMAPGASTAVEVVAPFVSPARVADLFASASFVGAGAIQFRWDGKTAWAIEANCRLGQNTRLLLPLLGRRTAVGAVLSDVLNGRMTDQLSPKPGNFGVPRVGTIALSPFDDVIVLRVHRSLQKFDDTRRRVTLPRRRAVLSGIVSSYLRPWRMDVWTRRAILDTRAVVAFYVRAWERAARPAEVIWPATRPRRPLRSLSRAA